VNRNGIRLTIYLSIVIPTMIVSSIVSWYVKLPPLLDIIIYVLLIFIILTVSEDLTDMWIKRKNKGKDDAHIS